MGEVREVAVVGVGVGAQQGQCLAGGDGVAVADHSGGLVDDGVVLAGRVGAGLCGVYGPVGGGITLAAAARGCAADMDADGLGVTLVVADELRLMGYATDERARRVEDAQLTTGEGPCADAFVRRTLVEEADLRQAHGRWTAFTRATARQHMRSVTALPLTTGPLRVGASAP
ncbi:hypothetical protein [Streptomyces sp. NPDC018059]|uniref:hypothetical protein n=1 Tax=Streptomyces sp. NPDC018059 TaxID=3365041 RepID=UPI0037B26809